ncbi:MAG: hypothetical protein LBS64_03280 [Spirochaetaceae bacterium]|nr:hypothetical protein [Spirochaetaceae bacterium]
MTFETCNESSLHRALKEEYAARFGGTVEQVVDGKVCDIVAADGTILEIQTTSLAKLAPKIAALLPRHRIRLVYPLVTLKYIELRDSGGTLISRRKSPKKQTIHSIFRELTGIYPWLTHEHFLLEALEVTVAEQRVRTLEPVQLPNKSRTFRRNWYKTGKCLLSRGDSRLFAGAADYAALLPQELPEEFSVRDLAQAGVGKNAPLMRWVLERMGVIVLLGKRGRARYYRCALRPILRENNNPAACGRVC